MSELAWTPKAREALSPRRGGKRRTFRSDREKVVAVLRAGIADHGARLRAGAATGKGEGALTLAALAHAEAIVAEPSTPIDGRLFGAAIPALLGYGHEPSARATLVGALLAAPLPEALRGLASALGVFQSFTDTGTRAAFGPLVLQANDAPSQSCITHLDEWEALRAGVVSADNAAYAAVRETAAEMRATASPVLRAAIAFVFPDEPAWAAEEARAFLAAPVVTAGGHRAEYGLPLLASLADPQLAVSLMEAGAKHGGWLPTFGRFACDGVRVAGELARAPLVAAFAITSQPEEAWRWWASDLKGVIVALSLFPGPQTSAALLPVLEHKVLGPAVVEYLRANPAEAVRALAPKLLESPKKAARAAEILTALARTEPDVVRDAAQSLGDASARAAVEKLAGASTAASNAREATPDELPRVLRDPPWRSKAPRPVLPVIEGLAMLPYDEKVDRAATKGDLPYYVEERPLSREELGKLEDGLAASIARGDRPRTLFSGAAYLPVNRLERDRVLAIWNGTPHWAFSMGDFASGYLLHRYGEAALPGSVALAEAYGESFALEALAACDTPHAARAMVRALKRRAVRAIATRWLGKHPRAAAIGLVPLALGTPGRDRDAALDGLRWLANNGHEAALRDVAQAHGPEVAQAVDAALAFDPLLVCPAKPPKLSAFFVPEAMPRVALKNGALLPIDRVGILGEMLQFSPVEPPYAGVADVKAALDPRSLAEFLWTLLGAWIQAGGSSANAWAMMALGHLGGDEIVRRLTPAIKRWPREKARPRALMGVDVLGMIGSDVALMHLSELADKAKNAQVEERAKALLAQVAEARGLDQESLGDRLIPDLGLDASGTLTLDFGPRSFVVRFSPQMEPELYEDGKKLKAIPRVTKDDDAAKAKAAQATWKALREDGKTVIASLSARLERAMCDGRSWEAPSFRVLMLEHPLVQLFARRLVWATVDDDGVVLATFRVAEDGTLAGIDDGTFALDEDASVALPHPLRLDEAARARWGQVLSDYEILQPFPQIGRELFPRPESSGHRLEGVTTREIPYHVLTGTLEARGWKRLSDSGLEGATDSYEKRVAGCEVTFSFSPPAYFREPPPERVTISGVAFRKPISAVSSIAYSEVARDAAAFT